jgi:rhodanese-related sulfurtransferase
MEIRGKISVVLLSLGFTLALLPSSGTLSFSVKPGKLMADALDNKSFFSVDQVARFLITEDSTVRVIDLRTPEEFRAFNIPGSVNIPYREFLNGDPGRFINSGEIKNIIYSNGDFESNYAFILARGMNYNNVFVMKGGLNEWFSSVMNSSFTGERISARENALFETRTRARKMFTEINSLPDSLKYKFMESKHIADKKLDGGCE